MAPRKRVSPPPFTPEQLEAIKSVLSGSHSDPSPSPAVVVSQPGQGLVWKYFPVILAVAVTLGYGVWMWRGDKDLKADPVVPAAFDGCFKERDDAVAFEKASDMVADLVSEDGKTKQPALEMRSDIQKLVSEFGRAAVLALDVKDKDKLAKAIGGRFDADGYFNKEGPLDEQSRAKAILYFRSMHKGQ